MHALCAIVGEIFQAKIHSVFRVLMCTRLENSVLRNRQQPGSAVNIFIDQHKIEGM